MLVLSRRVGESIVIDDNIRIKIGEVKGAHVRLGIEAPPQIPVDRQEVHERRKQFTEPLKQLMRTPAGASTNGVNGRCHAI